MGIRFLLHPLALPERTISWLRCPANNERMIVWADEYWEALHSFAAEAGGAYVNFMMEEGKARIQATYQDNHARLVEIKNKYDPENFFRINQNIRPTL